MPMTLADVDAFASTLPGVTVGEKWGNRTWMVGTKGFAWQRPLRKADLARLEGQPVPAGEILAVNVESLDAKDAILEIAPPGFFTIAHFKGYPAVLIELRKARANDVRRAIVDAFRLVAPRQPQAVRSRKRSAGSAQRKSRSRG